MFHFLFNMVGHQNGRLTFLFRMSIFARIPFLGLEADLALGCFSLLRFFFLPLFRLQFSTFAQSRHSSSRFFSSLLFFVSFVQTKHHQTALGGQRHRFPMFSLGQLFLFLLCFYTTVRLQFKHSHQEDSFFQLTQILHIQTNSSSVLYSSVILGLV